MSNVFTHRVLKKIKLHTSTIVLLSVLSTQQLAAEERQPVRGVVASGKEAVLSADLNARVVKSPVKTGESFKKDDLLIQFDCTALSAEKKAARAGYAAAKSVHANNLELQEYDAIGELELGISKAEMDQAKARAEVIGARSKDCVIKAPYNGRVAELLINNFETPGVNQPLIKIVGSDDLELRLIVPSNWLSWLQVGEGFTFSVDETGNQHIALVTRIGAEVDAVSRTISITAKFETQPETVLPGMSGSAIFPGSPS